MSEMETKGSICSIEGEYTMLLEVDLLYRELAVILDVAFEYAEDDPLDQNDDKTILNTVTSRIQDCSHEKNENESHVRCAITDTEIDILNNAITEVSPENKGIIELIQNNCKHVDELYRLETYIPMNYISEIESYKNDTVSVITKNNNIKLLNKENNEESKVYVCTYIKPEELKTIKEIRNKSIDKDISYMFCNISSITTHFNVKKEREEYIQNFQYNI